MCGVCGVVVGVLVVDGGVSVSSIRQCSRGIGRGVCSSAKIQGSSLVEHERQQLRSIARESGLVSWAREAVVMSTTSGAGMTHRTACAQALSRSPYLWAAKNRLSFLLGPGADQLVIFFRPRLSGHCLLFAEVHRPHLPLPTSRRKPLPAPMSRWPLAAGCC